MVQSANSCGMDHYVCKICTALICGVWPRHKHRAQHSRKWGLPWGAWAQSLQVAARAIWNALRRAAVGDNVVLGEQGRSRRMEYVKVTTDSSWLPELARRLWFFVSVSQRHSMWSWHESESCWRRAYCWSLRNLLSIKGQSLTDYLLTLITVSVLYNKLFICTVKSIILTANLCPQILHLHAMQAADTFF